MSPSEINSESEYDVTIKAGKLVTETQNTPEYNEDDSSAIYSMLVNNMKPIDFGFYLKRYIYKAAGYQKPFHNVSTDDYIQTISEAFSSKGISPFLKPTSTRPRVAYKNWLTQKTVSRETVIILGFGLGMSLEDVNSFLTKALQESSLNPKDPFETICWYCLRNHLGYYRFKQLISQYESLPGTADKDNRIDHSGTRMLRTEVEEISDDTSLLRYLNQLRRIDGQSRQSIEARTIFDQLYEKGCALIAELNNTIEDEKAEVELNRLKEQLSRNDRLYDEQKQDQIRRLSSQKKHWTKEDITPVNFEEVLFSAIPRDRNGNLLPMKGSMLNEQFRGKRLNRQHIQEILDGSGTINRYDLATMSFFVLSQEKDLEDNNLKCYQSYIDFTNQILDRCGMGKLYVANPYEAFLMICMLSDYPLGTYADVWEMSYEADAAE